MRLPQFRFANIPYEEEQQYTLEDLIGIASVMIPFIALSVLILWSFAIRLKGRWSPKPKPPRIQLQPSASILRSTKDAQTKRPEKTVRFTQETLNHQIEQLRRRIKVEHDEGRIIKMCEDVGIDPHELNKSVQANEND